MTRHSLIVLALVVSTGINLLMAGIVLGRLGLGGDWQRSRHEPPPVAWAARELSPETRSLIRQRMRERLSEVRPLRQELRSAQLAVAQAADAEDFDRERLARALAELRGVSGRYEALLHDKLAALAAELPREERAALLRTALLRDRAGKRPPPPPRG
ncbi:MAG: periplasmic heavy metal sensor [Halieaceae bacterium]|jgi:uncharacterized membrane protein|nr:periplasmic heavy metal sensor [Halieaceae bacterium]